MSAAVWPAADGSCPPLQLLLSEKQKVLAGEVCALLKGADMTDSAGYTRFGKDKRGDEQPPKLARREPRLVKLAEARTALEAEAAPRAMKHAEKQDREEDADDTEVAQKGEETEGNAVGVPTAQGNFTDPDARITKTADGLFH